MAAGSAIHLLVVAVARSAPSVRLFDAPGFSYALMIVNSNLTLRGRHILALARAGGIAEPVAAIHLISQSTATEEYCSLVRHCIERGEVGPLLGMNAIDITMDFIEVYAVVLRDGGFRIMAVLDPFEMLLDAYILGISAPVHMDQSFLKNGSEQSGEDEL